MCGRRLYDPWVAFERFIIIVVLFGECRLQSLRSLMYLSQKQCDKRYFYHSFLCTYMKNIQDVIELINIFPFLHCHYFGRL